MNADEVVEMMDAISEGRNYTLKQGGVTINFEKDWVTFFANVDGGSKLTETRRVREIIAGLLTWANRKDEMDKQN